MLGTCSPDMCEVRLHTGTEAGPPPTETSRCKGHAAIMPRRIESGHSDIACALGRSQQTVVAGVDQASERSRGVCGPLGAKILSLDIAGRNEHHGVVGLRNLIQPRSVGAVSVRCGRLKDIEAHVEYPHSVAGAGIRDG